MGVKSLKSTGKEREGGGRREEGREGEREEDRKKESWCPPQLSSYSACLVTLLHQKSPKQQHIDTNGT